MNQFALALMLPVVLAGCATTQPTEILPAISPADPAADPGSDSYSAVFAGFEPRKPTEPKPWRRRKEDGGDGGGS